MNDKANFQRYRPKRAYQEISEEIRKAILDGRLETGKRLPTERELAQQFQVGRLTIREALRTLEAKGLIQIKVGWEGGSFISTPDPDVMPAMMIDNLQLEGLTSSQAFEARIGLEPVIVKYAIQHATKEDFKRIEKNVRECREIMESASMEEIVWNMIDYHILIGEATHNPSFIMFIRALMEWARRQLEGWLPSPEIQLKSYQDHEKILESLKDSDVKRAQRRMEGHILRMSEYVAQRRRGGS